VLERVLSVKLMASLDNFEEFVKEKVEIYKCTHQQVSDELKTLFPGERGFSLRSVERFCCEKEIKKTTEIDDQQLDDVISEAVRQVSYRLKYRYSQVRHVTKYNFVQSLWRLAKKHIFGKL